MQLLRKTDEIPNLNMFSFDYTSMLKIYILSMEAYWKNHVVFYNQDAVFWAIPKLIQTITIPEERRRKQRKMRPYNNIIALLD